MKIIRYYRVSTLQQGRSGLGLEAQETAVDQFCRERGCRTLGTYTEIESGKNAERPELIKALAHAKGTNATLVIAKLDRLSRDIAFITKLMHDKVKFVCCDLPEANELTIHILAAFANFERKCISERTTGALQAAKARGTKLGNPNIKTLSRPSEKRANAAAKALVTKADAHAETIRMAIDRLRCEGINSLAGIADALNEGEFQTARGGIWYPTTVSNIIKRLERV